VLQAKLSRRKNYQQGEKKPKKVLQRKLAVGDDNCVRGGGTNVTGWKGFVEKVKKRGGDYSATRSGEGGPSRERREKKGSRGVIDDHHKEGTIGKKIVMAFHQGGPRGRINRPRTPVFEG